MKTFSARSQRFLAITVFSAAFSLLLLLPAAQSEARPAQCFGQKIDRVVKGANKTVRLAYKQVAWVEGENITVIGKPYSGEDLARRVRESLAEARRA